MILDNNILAHIGNSPVLSLQGLLPAGSAQLFVKLEGYNPGGSIKDRAALNMILEAEKSGKLKAGGTIVESTSGNLGAALAMIAAVRGYKCVIIVDPRTSQHNISMLKAFGAQVEIVTEKNPKDGTYQEARIKRAHYLADTLKNAYMPWQYGNPWNPAAHIDTTAVEILNDFPVAPDVLVAAVSTAGQITGIGKGVRKRGAKTKIVGVDVKGSIVFGGTKGPTAVTGMGLGWVPANLDEKVVDAAFLVDTQPCFSTVRIIAKKFGILLGGSSGASLFVAINQALNLASDKVVLAISADRGEKYLDEFYSDA
ncbi:MAG: hypothetical protein OFPI_08640 [Osedax symbiont Rs2]|nr:MAG: hypothetical protein OFPI_08640 [Osedax symbiont Rs2]